MTQIADARPKTNHIPWRTTLDAALQEARKSGKFVLLDFFNPG